MDGLHTTKKRNPIESVCCGVSVLSLFYSYSHARFKVRAWSREKGDQYRVSQAQQWGSGQVASNCCFLFMCSMLTSRNLTTGCGPIEHFNDTSFPIIFRNTLCHMWSHYVSAIIPRNILYNLSCPPFFSSKTAELNRSNRNFVLVVHFAVVHTHTCQERTAKGQRSPNSWIPTASPTEVVLNTPQPLWTICMCSFKRLMHFMKF